MKAAPSGKAKAGGGFGGRGRGRGRRDQADVAAPAAAPAAGVPSDLLDTEEDKAAYRLKMSKWAAGAMSTVRNSLFWLFLLVSEHVRAPLNHFFAWAQKNSENRLIQQLVCGKAKSFQDEFDVKLASCDTWFAEAVKEAEADDLPLMVLDLVRTLSFRMVAHAAASFYMRITMHVQRCSLQGTEAESKAPNPSFSPMPKALST